VEKNTDFVKENSTFRSHYAPLFQVIS